MQFFVYKKTTKSKHKSANVCNHLPFVAGEFTFLKYFFFNVDLFLRERERESEPERGRGRERETQNMRQAPGSELSAQSPTRGSNSPTARS